MAKDQPCSMCGQEVAIMTLQSLDSFEVVNIGPDCAFGALSTIAAQFAPDPMDSTTDAGTDIVSSGDEDGTGPDGPTDTESVVEEASSSAAE